MTSGQSTVIFVQSSAHWEALQKQKYASKHEEKESLPTETARVKPKKSPAVVKERNAMLTGKEGNRRKQRWTNNNFSDHPSAVLYAEDLRPPGYGTDKPLFKWTDKADLALDTDTTLVVDDGNDDITFLHLSRYMRHNLKRAQVPEGLVSTYESILVEFIDKWMDDPELLDTCFLELQVGSNRFERYVIHAMARYYGFYSFSQANEQGERLTYICHPIYTNFVEGKSTAISDYSPAYNWLMPEKSFFEYLFKHT